MHNLYKTILPFLIFLLLFSACAQTGADGKSAYELAVESGYTGNQDEFIDLLLGRSPNAAEGSQIVDNASGSAVPVPGKSAYEIAVDHGFIGTEEEWLNSLASGSSEELFASAYGILPGEVDMDAMNALLSLASEQNRTVRFGDGVYIFPSPSIFYPTPH